ncbi:MAG: DUF4127 family protein [Candidatus Gastranaerophilales bacterium]|nr:DUF4127 family protein [Candidatus Gastranaerophilales bacterium]
MKIALIPIDNRPVCYDLIDQIAGIDNDLELFLPDKKFLGGLKSLADVDKIIQWLDKTEATDAIIISLDTIAYGGLIPSRRSKDSFDEVKLRLENFREKIKGKCNKIYAFSSIMRVSNNNINEEEKEYWSEYGTKLFEYSYNFHKTGYETTDIPQNILNDYLATRQRNFLINKIYLQWLEEGIFDKLVFSKDDCSQFGLNVFEAEILQKIIDEKKLAAVIKTGADEIPLTLFARAVCDFKNRMPKISMKFLAPGYTHLISNYEDISIEQSVLSQIELSGCIFSEEKEADLILIVNNFEYNQGEIVMGIPTKGFLNKLVLSDKPYMLADVRFANGADNEFIKRFFKEKIDLDNFYGYSGWNTSANTLGSLICAGVVRFSAKKYNEEAFKKLQMVRLLDDWAYQANVRQILKGKGKGEKEKEPRPDFRKLGKLMIPYEKKLQKILDIKPKIKYKFPWKRFFEVEIIIR